MFMYPAPPLTALDPKFPLTSLLLQPMRMCEQVAFTFPAWGALG